MKKKIDNINIPVKPTHINSDNIWLSADTWIPACPECGTKLEKYGRVERCPQCHQLLDWSEY